MATQTLTQGEPVNVVPEIPGHTLRNTTADIYGEMFHEAFDEAADAMERALTG